MGVALPSSSMRAGERATGIDGHDATDARNGIDEHISNTEMRLHIVERRGEWGEIHASRFCALLCWSHSTSTGVIYKRRCGAQQF